MKFHYGGKYKGEESLIAKREHHEGAVAFREPSHNMFALIGNVGSIVLGVILFIIIYIITKPDILSLCNNLFVAAILSLVFVIPHEFLHAICFKKDVYMYTNLSKMMLFVHGTEDMSKSRFIFMSLLPNIVFGFAPFILFFIFQDWLLIGCIGAINICMGFGDYINVFNAATQMPKGAKTYLYGFHSYWYKD